MAKATTKARAVAFKVEPELAEFLSALPNRSEFIRMAILSRFVMNCPLCDGTGVVPRGVGELFAPILIEANVVACRICHDAAAIPSEIESLQPADQHRWELFLRGGEYHCRPCFEKTPYCREDGWPFPSQSQGDSQEQFPVSESQRADK